MGSNAKFLQVVNEKQMIRNGLVRGAMAWRLMGGGGNGMAAAAAGCGMKVDCHRGRGNAYARTTREH